MEYESSILKRLIDTYGVVGNPRYISEIIKEFIVQGKERFPNLFTYQADWLAHIDEFGLNPSYTVSYTGQSIYAPNTLERPVKSAILKGQTLVNVFSNATVNFKANATHTGNKTINLTSTGAVCHSWWNVDLQTTKQYMLSINIIENTSTGNLVIKTGDEKTVKNFDIGVTGNQIIVFTPTNSGIRFKIESPSNTGTTIIDEIMLIEYQEGMENWDIPYFEEMQSVKLPVLTTTGKNLINQASEINDSTVTDTNMSKYTYDNSTNTSCVYSSGWAGYYQHYLKVIPNKTYYFYSEVTWGIHLLIKCNEQNIAENIISGSETDNNYYQSKVVSFVPSTDEICISYRYRTLNKNGYAKNIVISDVNITSFEPYKSNILTVNEDVTLRSNGSVCDELDLLTGKLTQRIDEDGEILTQEVVKTVDLNILDQNGQNIKQLMSFNGGTHFKTGSAEGSPLPVVSVSVETDLEETLKVCSLEGNTM